MKFELATADYVERTKSKRVSDSKARELLQLKEPLAAFLEQVDGVGITGIQIGIPYRFSLYVLNYDEPFMFFNATYTTTGSNINHTEGCLSYPNREAKLVKRYSSIVAYYDEWNAISQTLQQTSRHLHGIEAYVFAHEADHQNGHTIYKY